MYSQIITPCDDIEAHVETIQLLEAQLAESVQKMLPILEQRNIVNTEFQYHLSEGSNAWEMGDKGTWLLHKKLREPHQKLLYPLKREIEVIKNGNAEIVEKLVEAYSIIHNARGEHREYVGDVLGTATRTVSFPDNTREWHDQRAKGIGGSDVGAILGHSPWSSREDIFKIKTGQEIPELKSKGAGHLWRGSVWENYIAHQFAVKNPEHILVHSKSSWQNDLRSHQLANLDGLLYKEGATEPHAILEIKTSSTPDSWEFGVPIYYRMQVLWYMDAFGLKQGYLAVMIDDHDLRQYEIVPRPGEMERIHEKVEEFVAEVEDYRTNKAKYDAINASRMESLRPKVAV